MDSPDYDEPPGSLPQRSCRVFQFFRISAGLTPASSCNKTAHFDDLCEKMLFSAVVLHDGLYVGEAKWIGDDCA